MRRKSNPRSASPSVQVPVAISVTLGPDTVHFVGVRGVRVTARPELAETVGAKVVPSIWLEMAGKVIVCGISWLVSAMFCEAALLAVTTTL